MTTTHEPQQFIIGDTWEIEVACHDGDNNVLSLTDVTEITWTLEQADGTIALTLTKTGGDISVSEEDGPNGICLVTVPSGQTAALAPNSYYDSLRVAFGNVVSFQVQGRIDATTTIDAPAIMEFRTRFEELSEIEYGVLQLYIRDATALVEREGVFSGDEKTTATVYLAAHLLQMRTNAAKAFAAGGAPAGPIRVMRIEDRMVAYGTTTSATALKGLAQTIYGQTYLSLRRQYPTFLKRV